MQLKSDISNIRLFEEDVHPLLEKKKTTILHLTAAFGPQIFQLALHQKKIA